MPREEESSWLVLQRGVVGDVGRKKLKFHWSFTKITHGFNTTHGFNAGAQLSIPLFCILLSGAALWFVLFLFFSSTSNPKMKLSKHFKMHCSSVLTHEKMFPVFVCLCLCVRACMRAFQIPVRWFPTQLPALPSVCLWLCAREQSHVLEGLRWTHRWDGKELKRAEKPEIENSPEKRDKKLLKGLITEKKTSVGV